jgi:hypothetical protein
MAIEKKEEKMVKAIKISLNGYHLYFNFRTFKYNKF